MQKSRFAQPYKGSKTNFPESKGKSGIYLIKENGILVYVGYSGSSLYRTLYRHFENWTHKTQQVVTYVSKMQRKAYTVRIVYCSKAQAERLERALIIKYRPRDNQNKYLNYQLDLKDKTLVSKYENMLVSTEEAPF